MPSDARGLSAIARNCSEGSCQTSAGGDELTLIVRSPRGNAGEVIEAVLLYEAEAKLGFVGLHGLRLVRSLGRQDRRDVVAQANIVALGPLDDELGLRLADRT